MSTTLLIFLAILFFRKEYLVMSLFESLVAKVKDVGERISDSVKSVVSEFVKIAPHLEKIGLHVAQLAPHPIAKLVGGLLVIASRLGIEFGNPEDLGDKVIQAKEQGVSRQDFDSDKQYRDFIRDFEPDPERSKQISEHEKYAAASLIIMGSLSEVLAQEHGVSIEELVLLMLRDVDGLDANVIEKLLRRDPRLLNKAADYLDNQLSFSDVLAFEAHLESVLVETGLSPDEAKDTVAKMKA